MNREFCFDTIFQEFQYNNRILYIISQYLHNFYERLEYIIQNILRKYFEYIEIHF